MKPQAFLPLVTYPDPNGEATAANAVAVSDYLGAGLHALALEADIPSVSNALSNMLMNLPELIRDAEKLSARRGAQLLKAIEDKAAHANVTVTAKALRAQPPQLPDLAATHARYNDLALVGWSADNPGARTLAEAVVFGSGRPTLLMPEAMALGRLGHVAIAWDGSRVAARAVADARPLLERASSITVMVVVDEKPLDKRAGERLVEHFRGAGLEAELKTFRTDGADIATALQLQAIRIDANVLVMGGFGHSRLRDFVLGGATAGVLAKLRLPVLLSH